MFCNQFIFLFPCFFFPFFPSTHSTVYLFINQSINRSSKQSIHLFICLFIPSVNPLICCSFMYVLFFPLFLIYPLTFLSIQLLYLVFSSSWSVLRDRTKWGRQGRRREREEGGVGGKPRDHKTEDTTTVEQNHCVCPVSNTTVEILGLDRQPIAA